jgi:uncharacterized membrane protein
MAFCPNCGSQIAENVAFCPTCGKATGQAGATAAAPPPPPPPAYTTPATTAPVTAAPPLEENIAGMLAYITIIPAIIFLLVEPYNRNRFIRFHSFQCLFFHLAVVVIDVGLMVMSAIFHLVPVIGWFVTALMWPLVGLAIFGVWVLLMIKAFQHQIYKLPIIGDIAEKQAGV